MDVSNKEFAKNGLFISQNIEYWLFMLRLKSSSSLLALGNPIIKIINKETLSYLKDNTVVANAARGDVVDDDAMVASLKSGKVFAYGLDVYNGEPKIHPEYLKLKNIFLLPHLGSATKRTRWDMAYRATKNLEDFFTKGTAKDTVN